MDKDIRQGEKVSVGRSPRRRRANRSACVLSVGLLTNAAFRRTSDAAAFRMKNQVKRCQTLPVQCLDAYLDFFFT